MLSRSPRPSTTSLIALALALAPAACQPADDDDTAVGDDDTGDDDEDAPPGWLTLPVAEIDRVALPVVGADHDPEDYSGAYQLICADYLGRPFPHCYDGHDGSDYLLDGGFEAMDEGGSATVIAAAAGTVVSVEDGHYDHCHGDLGTMDVDCDGHEMVGNHVILEHAGGYRTLYWHFMKDSILVAEDDVVDAGAPLGRMGSSGRSSQPHLHFELHDADGAWIDPYAGELSQPDSHWCDQGHPDGLPGGCEP